MRNVDLNVTFYYIINDDLKMSRGKIAAQISHVAMLLADKHPNILGRAIVLKAPEYILKRLIDWSSEYRYNVVYIKDAGLTEVPKGALTCIGFKRLADFDVKNLKLL